jgi:hypothetical protein
MILTLWVDQLELWRPFRPPPDLMLDVRKKLEPGLILNPAERMVLENVGQLDHFRLKLILKTVWRRIGSFRSVLRSIPFPTSFDGREGAFLSCCW